MNVALICTSLQDGDQAASSLNGTPEVEIQLIPIDQVDNAAGGRFDLIAWSTPARMHVDAAHAREVSSSWLKGGRAFGMPLSADIEWGTPASRADLLRSGAVERAETLARELGRTDG